FKSPKSLEVAIELPDEREVVGMGIPEGITLIVGGGFHGKSTLLDALARCVYPHIPGDGREYVVTDEAAVVIRSEDGRYVEKVDISPFVSNLPYGRDTKRFSTENASGSTSQAANIVEAMELGAKVLLIDEDTSASNFMIRDARMQRLVAKEAEPITPFVDRARELYDRFGISTVLVMGGSGDYFDVADVVIKMVEYVPHDATAEAKRIAGEMPTNRQHEAPEPMGECEPRLPDPKSFDPSKGRREVKIGARGLHQISFGRTAIDLDFVEQIVDTSQTRAIGEAIHYYSERYAKKGYNLAEGLRLLMKEIEDRGLDVLDPRKPADLATPRIFEIGAAINRMRTLHIKDRKT
ncbi:MAG TPA: ATPase, partial [Proteobacteria bacterium]|nr:ATPase [Pseudomonadota bacterium]